MLSLSAWYLDKEEYSTTWTPVSLKPFPLRAKQMKKIGLTEKQSPWLTKAAMKGLTCIPVKVVDFTQSGLFSTQKCWISSLAAPVCMKPWDRWKGKLLVLMDALQFSPLKELLARWKQMFQQ